MNKLLLILAITCLISCNDTAISGTNKPTANNQGPISNAANGNATSTNQTAAETAESTTEIVQGPESKEVKEERMNKVAKGQKINDAKYLDVAGNANSFDGLRGKTVVIDLWATWCTPCIDAMPAFDKLASDNSTNEDLVFLKLSIDEDRKYWEDYVKEKNHDTNSNWIGRNENNPLFWLTYKNISYEGKDMVLESLPRYVIIGPDGAIVDKEAPSPMTNQLMEAISAINI